MTERTYGVGAVGQRLLTHVGAHPRFTVLAGWDVDPVRRTAAAAAVPGPALGADAGAAVRTPGVDLVYVATPPLHHAPLVDLALAAGRAVFCEKPLGIDRAASRALVERVAASGRPATVNFVFAAAPAAVRLVELAPGGPGRVDLRFATWPRAFQAEATWLARREEGGFTREVVSHFVFLLGRLFGPVRVESASLTWPPSPGAETALSAVLRCGDVPVTVQAAVGGGERVELRAGGWLLQDGYRLQDPDGAGVVQPTDGGGPYAAQLTELAALLDGGPSRCATYAEALAVQEVVEQLLRA